MAEPVRPHPSTIILPLALLSIARTEDTAGPVTGSRGRAMTTSCHWLTDAADAAGQETKTEWLRWRAAGQGPGD